MFQSPQIISSSRLWRYNILFWTSIVFLDSIQSYIALQSEGAEGEITRLVMLKTTTYCPWAFIGPALFMYFHKFPLDRFFSVRTLVFLPMIAVVSCTAQIAFQTLGAILFASPRALPGAFGTTYLGMLQWVSVSSLLVFTAITGFSHAIHHYQLFRQKEITTSRLERELAEARLNALQMQLQPHFFFNTLHSIASLVRDQQRDAAVNMIARLSDLFRYVLDQAGTQKISLRHEIEFISTYLEIEQTRFSDQLFIEFKTTPDSLGALVPSLFLQPLVENSLKHGVSRRGAPSKLTIETRIETSMLVIQIVNDGIGLAESWEYGAEIGVGIHNTRNRLGQLYGNRYKFELEEIEDRRVMTRVSLPFETTPATPSEYEHEKD